MPGLLPNVDPDGLLEFSVVYTDRSLNHMSEEFKKVMVDISSVLKDAYQASSAIVVPGSGTFGMTPEPMAAPANALMPTAAPAKRALTTEDKINNLIRGGFAEEARVLQAQQTALNRENQLLSPAEEAQKIRIALASRPPAAPRPEPAPSIAQIEDPNNPGRIITVDARRYVPGTNVGVIGSAGKGTSDAKVSEQQASYNVSRILSAANQIADITSTNESANKPGVLEAAAGSVGFSGTANLARSGDRQVVYGAQRDALDAMLYLATGAAYNKEQLEGITQSYIPAFTDTTQAIDAKRQRWVDLIEAAKIRSGKSWSPKLEQSLQQIIPVLSTSSNKKPAGRGIPPTAPGGAPATGNLTPAEQAELDQLRKRFGK
jgi:hypothetical protein